jgi:hypothetical protein
LQKNGLSLSDYTGPNEI